MTIEKFDRDILKLLRTDIDKALLEVGNKYGINLKMGNISFTEEEFSGKVKAAVANKKEQNEEEKFKNTCRLVGLTAEDFGMVFVLNGKTYVVCAIDLNKRKYPLIAMCKNDSKRYKFPVSYYKTVATNIYA